LREEGVGEPPSIKKYTRGKVNYIVGGGDHKGGERGSGDNLGESG